MDRPVTGRDVILDIVENMRQNREPLLYSTVVPTMYEVYLHPDDYERLQGVFPVIVEQARRALDEQLARLNQPLPGPSLLRRLVSRGRPPAEPPRAGWHISFHPDADDELAPGEIVVSSRLSLPPKPEYGVGAKTRRITTSRTGDRTTSRAEMSEGTDGAAGPVLATIAYEDESGRHVYEVRKPEIVIGRGGVGYWVDLKLDVVADVSREHARLRRDETSGRFYIKDLSRFGTTVDGRPIASSVETRRGDERRDLGVEELLPPVARIGLAGLVFLDFKATPSP